MALASGSRLGSYEILAPLGAGGMGEVFRARDLKLSREVALKVLPTEFALDAERLARFKREAQSESLISSAFWNSPCTSGSRGPGLPEDFFPFVIEGRQIERVM
jgi:hypothetical protein